MGNCTSDGITTVLKYMGTESEDSQTELENMLDVGTTREGYIWLNVTDVASGTLTVEAITSARNQSDGDYLTTGTAQTATGATVKSIYVSQVGRYVGIKWQRASTATFEALFVRKDWEGEDNDDKRRRRHHGRPALRLA